MYSILNIGMLPNATAATPRGINASGQVVGSCSMPGNAMQAFIWDQNNGMRALPSPGGNCRALAINSDGVIAGDAIISAISPTIPCATLWQNGLVIAVLNQTSNASDINDSAVAACTIFQAGTVYAGTFSTTGFTPLPPTNQSSRAYGINISGQVVGSSDFTSPGATEGAALWNAAQQPQFLGALGGNGSEAIKINVASAAIGNATDSSGNQRGFLWMPSLGMTDLNSAGEPFFPMDINDGGSVVGIYQAVASIKDGNGIQELNPLVLPGSNPLLDIAWGINASGQIICTGSSNAAVGAFLLTPILIRQIPPMLFTCGSMLQRYLQWSTDLTRLQNDLANQGTPPGDIPNNASVKALGADLTKLTNEMTQAGCPPPTLLKVSPHLDQQP
jgi:hypothetical protein